MDGRIKAAEAVKASKTAPYAKEHESSFTGLSADQRQKYLSMSFQRTAEDFAVPAEEAISGQKAAQDSAAVQGIKQMRMNGLAGTGQDKIYEFYGMHGFIGWQLCAVIAQNWAVQNACTIPAEDAARPGWENRFAEGTAAETESGTDAADIPAKVKELALQKYGLMQALIRHARNMKIFGVSYLLPVFDTGYDYSKPYNPDGIQPGSFKGFKVIDPYWAMPQWGRQSMSDPASMAFYEPAYYALPGGIKIHSTQILKAVNAEVPDILKPSYYFGGIPLTQMIYERVYAAEKVANEAPLMALTKRTSVLYTNLDDVLENPDVAARNLATITRFRDNQGIMLQDTEARYEQHDISLADFDALISTQYQLVAAVAKMPAEKLFKTPISGLGQTGAYAEHDYKQELQSLQERVYMPAVNRANEIIMRSNIGSDAALTAAFCPVDMPTEREKAEMQELKARVNTSYLNAGVITPEEARDALRQDKDSGYAGLTDEVPEDYGAEAGNEPPEGNSGNGGGQGQPGGNPQAGQDYVPPDELEGFRNMNGANVPLSKGQTKAESIKQFINEKEAERKAEKEKKEEIKTESAAEKQEQPKENKNENTVEKGEEKQEQAKGTGTKPNAENKPHKPAKEFFGKEYKGYKGQAAVQKLAKEKNGHIKGAFHRSDIGDIDLVWGSYDEGGLCHLIKRRDEDGYYAAEEILNNMTDIVENGQLRKNKEGKYEIWYKKKMIIVRPDYYGEDIRWVLSGFKQRKPNK